MIIQVLSLYNDSDDALTRYDCMILVVCDGMIHYDISTNLMNVAATND